MSLVIRKAEDLDFEGVWEIFSGVVSLGGTYVFLPTMKKHEAKLYWMDERHEVYVAEMAGKIVGTYYFKANQMGLGDHVANGSYMVHPDYHGQGIGFTLGAHSLEMMALSGFSGVQFNIVVATNTPAISLWKKLGFSVVGQVPLAFRHLKQGPVDGLIMYRSLSDYRT